MNGVDVVSVVIPAHDEERTIERCLDALHEGLGPGELDVVVVCNGCTDATAERARAHPARPRVIETELASKSHALRTGDALARGFPRFFVDADVVLRGDSLLRTAEALRREGVMAASPRMRPELAGCGALVRAYYRVWMALPYARRKMIGSGVYGLSREGRARFAGWPDLIADDEMVRRTFADHEKESVEGASFVFFPPRRLRRLIAIEVRRRQGTREARERFPASAEQERGRQLRGLLRLARDPRRWPDLGLYAGAKLAAGLALWVQGLRGRRSQWLRDDSSRRA